MPRFEAIIFDMDGVLADSIGAHTSARLKAFEQLGFSASPEIQAEAHRHGSHGPQIILTRSDVAFVKKLFEIEVPEITESIVEVKGISREAGERTKIAVWSKDEKVDAVGACVGMRGSRVKDIVRELQGERVDIVRWSDDLKEYVKAYFSLRRLHQ